MTLIDRQQRERIVLVGVAIPPAGLDDTETSLDELALLIDTAGADEADRIVQRRDRPDPATFVGKGKAEDLLASCLAVDADYFGHEDSRVFLAAQNMPDRPGNIGWRERSSCYLVKQWLKTMIVVPID